MKSILVQPLQLIINQCLKNDPDALRKLDKLQNKVFEFTVSDWQLTLFITIVSDGVLLSTEYQPADATIAGTLDGILKAGYAKACNQPLNTRTFDVSGDIDAGESLADVLTQLDLDWEEQLSRLVGDGAAHHIGAGVRKLLKFKQDAAAALGINLKEYLQQESQALPTSDEVDQFIDQVATLRDDVARFEARLTRYKQTRV